jgi:VanZ family protein
MSRAIANERIFQTAAWLLLIAIAVLSVVPSEDRAITTLPQPIEHFAIFLATGSAFRLGYSSRYCALALILFTAAIELTQLWIPGRHARLSDLIVNLLGLGVGIGLALWLDGLRWTRMQSK